MNPPAILATLVLALAIPAARATVTLDVRATSATGAATVLDSKHISLGAAAASGSIITLGIYAIVTGAAGNALLDEKFQSALFSMATFANGPKNIHGDLAPLTLDPTFRSGFLSTGGASADLNADGDLDVGGPFIGDRTILSHYIYARASTLLGEVPGNSTDLPGETAAREWLLGTTTLTVTSALPGASILANAIFTASQGPNNPFGSVGNLSTIDIRARALYIADGLVQNAGSATEPNVFTGADVTIASISPETAPGSIPEPTVLLTALSGGIGLLAFRRRRA